VRILVFGASGGTGQLVVKQALRRGHVVTAFVRSPADFGMAGANLAVFTGNVTDADAVQRAMKDQDAVISTLGVSRKLQPDPGVVRGVSYILEAMAARGVTRLIYQSFVGVRESRRYSGLFTRLLGARLLRHEIADHEAKEALIRATSLDWTIVRPAKLTNGGRTGQYRSGEGIPARSLFPRIARADVADFLVGQITDRTFIRKSPSVMR
jgi:putative NADH-flavin reductase